jgi:hypothetical protein
MITGRVESNCDPALHREPQRSPGGLHDLAGACTSASASSKRSSWSTSIWKITSSFRGRSAGEGSVSRRTLNGQSTSPIDSECPRRRPATTRRDYTRENSVRSRSACGP